MKEYIVAEHPDFPYEEPKPQELIRCKDCRYYEVYERKYDGSADKRFKPSICTRAYEYAVAKAPNWFCADAEPKEADG
jgi:hypothetical protein